MKGRAVRTLSMRSKDPKKNNVKETLKEPPKSDENSIKDTHDNDKVDRDQLTMEEANNSKRRRRTFKELERSFVCEFTSCQRPYASEHSLNQHIRLKHSPRSQIRRRGQAPVAVMTAVAGCHAGAETGQIQPIPIHKYPGHPPSTYQQRPPQEHATRIHPPSSPYTKKNGHHPYTASLHRRKDFHLYSSSHGQPPPFNLLRRHTSPVDYRVSQTMPSSFCQQPLHPSNSNGFLTPTFGHNPIEWDGWPPSLYERNVDSTDLPSNGKWFAPGEMIPLMGRTSLSEHSSPVGRYPEEPVVVSELCGAGLSARSIKSHCSGNSTPVLARTRSLDQVASNRQAPYPYRMHSNSSSISTCQTPQHGQYRGQQSYALQSPAYLGTHFPNPFRPSSTEPRSTFNLSSAKFVSVIDSPSMMPSPGEKISDEIAQSPQQDESRDQGKTETSTPSSSVSNSETSTDILKATAESILDSKVCSTGGTLGEEACEHFTPESDSLPLLQLDMPFPMPGDDLVGSIDLDNLNEIEMLSSTVDRNTNDMNSILFDASESFIHATV
eukprot:CFRG7268T1